MIRVVVVDDQPVVRMGFGALLAAQPDMDVVGEAANGADAVSVATRTRPDVVVMDVRMPVMDGIESSRRITSLPEPTPRVLILTTFGLDRYVYDALRAGASGFLLKDANAEQICEGVRVLAAGDALLAPSVTRRLITDLGQRRTVRKPRELALLTPRELEILLLVGHGLSNAEIAQRLVLAEQTVKTHVSRVFAKLHLRDRAQAVVLVYEAGLVVPGAPESGTGGAP
jgi:DNA-binding NarL/FixJ family response regulator